jgi:hypothetical protein
VLSVDSALSVPIELSTLETPVLTDVEIALESAMLAVSVDGWLFGPAEARLAESVALSVVAVVSTVNEDEPTLSDSKALSNTSIISELLLTEESEPV